MSSVQSRSTPLQGGSGLIAALVGAIALAITAPAQAQSTPIKISPSGTAQVHSGAAGPNVVSTPEVRDDGVEVGVKQQTAGISPPAAASVIQAAARRTGLSIPSKEAARLHRGSDRAGLAGANARGGSGLPPPPTANPNPSGLAVGAAPRSAFGFAGLSHFDQRTAGTGAYVNTQFSLEPPDQGLCAGNGFVVEAINNAIEIFDTRGHSLAGPQALSQFWGLTPEIDRTTGIAGQFISDPRCTFDKQTQRWFVTELMQDSGDAGSGRNFNMIAVSQSADPRGGIAVFLIDVTDDGLNGTPNHPGCPCFGDQPLIGLDRHGFYITTNEFGTGFNGAQVYALSKSGLVRAANGDLSGLTGVVIDASAALLNYGGLSYSIQPAIGYGGDGDEGSGGVEYFLSALQFGNPGYEVLDNRIAIWALTNTASLETAKPNVTLTYQVMASQTYGQPNPVQQAAGPTPLGTALGDPLSTLNSNDDRMNQVVYANGLLYGALNTIIGDGSRTGIAWFAVQPGLNRGAVTGAIKRQGYVAVDGQSTIFPSIAVTNDGESGLIAFTLAGPDYFPSAAYVSLNGNRLGSTVNVAAAGQLPADGFTGYTQYGGDGTERWGDYSAAVTDGNSLWFANEYISSGPRTSLANWATWIGRIGR